MAFAQRAAICLLVPLAVLTAGAVVAGDARVAGGETAAPTWQAQAAATAQAAAEQATKEQAPALVPPEPKPAERPAATKAEPSSSPEKPNAAAATPKDAPGAADTKPKEKADTDGKADTKKKAKKQIAAKQLFGTVKTGAPMKARAVGWYAKGCLAGAKALAVDGPGWQVMRLSRNRNWGHPDLIALIERLARESTAAKEWPGLLVGDISQPRGGPMISGHSSHQVGLDADIWLTPMPDRKLTRREREDMSAVSMLAGYDKVNPKVWGKGQEQLIKRAASYPEVERVLVHPALKKALCESAGPNNRSWLNKVRPIFGHYYHFHIRIGCPKGSNNCQSQPAVPGNDGCGAELTDWLKRVAPKPKPKPKPPAEAAKPPSKPAKPPAKKPEITLADLPGDCATVLTAGGHVPPANAADAVDRSKNAAPTQAFAPATETPAATPAAATGK